MMSFAAIMKRYWFLAIQALGVATGLVAAGAAENWPGWRGLRGDGTVEQGSSLPVKWSVPENVIWKTALPGKGHASPIIWLERIFLVEAVKETQERVLISLDRRDGKVLWQKTVLKAPIEHIHPLNSYASSTPVTDGERVYVSFLDDKRMCIAAYDFEGKEMWRKHPGAFSSTHGYCASPILWKDKVIVNGDHDGDAYIVALDRATGGTIWKTDRPNKTRSYCTPIIREIDGRTQMILSGSKSVASYDPDTGKQHWVIDGPTEQYVASIVYNGKYLFMTCGFPERHLLAIDPRGSGNVTETHVVWRTTDDCSYVPSPVLVGEYLLMVSDKGVASCFIADSGEKLWSEKLPKRHSASLVTANGLAYFLSDQGVMTVVKPGKTFEKVAENQLGEESNASPAVYDGKFYLRGDKHLYCIGTK
jgi:outer membrane protein assembly factor BamB